MGMHISGAPSGMLVVQCAVFTAISEANVFYPTFSKRLAVKLSTFGALSFSPNVVATADD